MALVREQGDACPGCGEPLSVTTDPESEGKYRADSVRCHACAAQARAGSNVDDKAGLLVHFTHRPQER